MSLVDRSPDDTVTSRGMNTDLPSLQQNQQGWHILHHQVLLLVRLVLGWHIHCHRGLLLGCHSCDIALVSIIVKVL